MHAFIHVVAHDKPHTTPHPPTHLHDNSRYGEKPLTDVYLYAKKLAQAMDALGLLKSQIPLLFFGHSFGAIVATLTAQVLRNQYGYTPKHLVVSGCVPLHVRSKVDTYALVTRRKKRGSGEADRPTPHTPTNTTQLRAGRPKFSVPNDDQLVQSLLDMGGITKEMARNREVVSQFLPALKGDYLAVDKYVYHEGKSSVCLWFVIHVYTACVWSNIYVYTACGMGHIVRSEGVHVSRRSSKAKWPH